MFLCEIAFASDMNSSIGTIAGHIVDELFVQNFDAKKMPQAKYSFRLSGI